MTAVIWIGLMGGVAGILALVFHDASKPVKDLLGIAVGGIAVGPTLAFLNGVQPPRDHEIRDAVANESDAKAKASDVKRFEVPVHDDIPRLPPELVEQVKARRLPVTWD